MPPRATINIEKGASGVPEVVCGGRGREFTTIFAESERDNGDTILKQRPPFSS